MFERFTKRSSETERLDRGEFTIDEFELWNKEMWYVHRLFGETRALKNSIIREIDSAGECNLSVLDVAAGSGELLEFIRTRTTAKDVFSVGAESSAESAVLIAGRGITSVRCDALALPFAPNSFDFVFCTLFLHHLDDTAATLLMRQMASIARQRFFVIDLDRRPLPYFAYRILGSVLLQPFTRDDGALSILRAHSICELRHIAANAEVKNVKITRSAVNRLIMSANA